MPFGLIGKTVQVVSEGGAWVMRYRARGVAEHPMLTGRARLSVYHEHGPGAAARNSRQRYADSELPIMARGVDAGREVEVRDLAVYDRLFTGEPAEAT